VAQLEVDTETYSLLERAAAERGEDVASYLAGAMQRWAEAQAGHGSFTAADLGALEERMRAHAGNDLQGIEQAMDQANSLRTGPSHQ